MTKKQLEARMSLLGYELDIHRNGPQRRAYAVDLFARPGDHMRDLSLGAVHDPKPFNWKYLHEVFESLAEPLITIGLPDPNRSAVYGRSRHVEIRLADGVHRLNCDAASTEIETCYVSARGTTGIAVVPESGNTITITPRP